MGGMQHVSGCLPAPVSACHSTATVLTRTVVSCLHCCRTGAWRPQVGVPSACTAPQQDFGELATLQPALLPALHHLLQTCLLTYLLTCLLAGALFPTRYADGYYQLAGTTGLFVSNRESDQPAGRASSFSNAGMQLRSKALQFAYIHFAAFTRIFGASDPVQKRVLSVTSWARMQYSSWCLLMLRCSTSCRRSIRRS